MIKDEPLRHQCLTVILGFLNLTLLCSSWLRKTAIPRSFLEDNSEYLNAKLLGYTWAFAEGGQEKKSLFLSALARIPSQCSAEKAPVDFFPQHVDMWCKLYLVKYPSCCPTNIRALLSSLMRWVGNWDKRMWKEFSFCLLAECATRPAWLLNAASERKPLWGSDNEYFQNVDIEQSAAWELYRALGELRS